MSRQSCCINKAVLGLQGGLSTQPAQQTATRGAQTANTPAQMAYGAATAQQGYAQQAPGLASDQQSKLAQIIAQVNRAFNPAKCPHLLQDSTCNIAVNMYLYHTHSHQKTPHASLMPNWKAISA